VEGQLAAEKEKAQILAAHLRSLGVDPDSLANSEKTVITTIKLNDLTIEYPNRPRMNVNGWEN
jgi:hypothetical protein